MKVKIDPADAMFSKYIRKRDKHCVRCGSMVEFNSKGEPATHQNSHYFGRGKESTRFDPENCDTLCFGCHKIWGSDDKEGYRNFKINQLGQQGFDLLCLRSNTPSKKDRRLSYLYAKTLYDELV